MNRFALLLLAALVFPATGCARKPRSLAAGVLRYPLTEEPASLDPALVTSADTNEMIYNVFEGLVRFDKEMKLISWLADSWELSADKRTYTFHLNPRAKFHRPYSRPVTAADVKWSLERIMWPETKSLMLGALLVDVEGAKAVLDGKTKECSGIKVIDEKTLSITAVRPCSYLLQEIGTPIYCREAVEKGDGKVTAQNAIGTGPYMLQEYRSGSYVRLTANPEYYRGRPKLEAIERPITLDPLTAHVAFENGETHITRISIQDYLHDIESPQLKDRVLQMDWSGTSYITMQPNAQPAFRDRRVRRAIAEAINRDRIIELAFHGTRVKAGAFLPPGIVGYSTQIRAIPYDPAHARRLLAEAGYPGGKGFPALTFEYVQQNPAAADVAAIVRDDLREHLGIQVDLREREAGGFYADKAHNKVPFSQSSWTTFDPHDFLTLMMRTGGRFNTFGYSNPRFDALVDRADSEFDPAKRAALFAEADQVQLDDAVCVPLVYNRVPYLIDPRVRDLEYNLGGLMMHMKTWMAP